MNYIVALAMANGVSAFKFKIKFYEILFWQNSASSVKFYCDEILPSKFSKEKEAVKNLSNLDCAQE